MEICTGRGEGPEEESLDQASSEGRLPEGGPRMCLVLKDVPCEEGEPCGGCRDMDVNPRVPALGECQWLESRGWGAVSEVGLG